MISISAERQARCPNDPAGEAKDHPTNHGWWSNGILDIVAKNSAHSGEARAGHWNDPDMLEVGVHKPFFGAQLALTDEEGRSQFSLWAMMASPLIAGNDLTSMSAATRATLTNAEVIAVDQDPLVVQGTQVKKTGELEVWSKPLQGHGVRAVALFNRSGAATKMSVRWADIGLADSPATVRDLWTHTDQGAHANGFTATVPGHGVVMLKVAGSQAGSGGSR